MSQDNARETAQVVTLFQDAHQKMVMLKRVDEQMSQLLARRRSIMDELRNVQAQINDEFERTFTAPNEQPGRLQALTGQAVRAATFHHHDVVATADDDAAVA